MSIRIVLADDHAVFVTALYELLSRDPEFQIVASCEDGRAALEAVRRERPDVLLLDVRMPGVDGLSVVREIKREALPTKVVLLTAEIDEAQTIEAMRLGVEGVMLKQMAARLLVACLHKVHKGGYWIERDSMRRALEFLLHPETVRQPPRRASVQPASALTLAEQSVVKCLAAGLRNKEIAEQLNVAESTIKNHLHNIYVKLGVTDRRALVAFAAERGR